MADYILDINSSNDTPTTLASYTQATSTYSTGMYNGATNPYNGQEFQNTASVIMTLDSLVVTIMKTGNPTGYCYCNIYNQSGTYGTNGVATGLPIATSDGLAMSIVLTSLKEFTFTFSGSNRITLSPSTYYVFEVYYLGGNGSNTLRLGVDGVTKSYGGNRVYGTGSTWISTNATDTPFKLYGVPASTGYFKLTGNSINITIPLRVTLSATTCTYSLTGVSLNTKRNYNTICNNINFILNGSSTNITRQFTLQVNSINFNLTSYDIIIIKHIILQLSTLNYSVTNYNILITLLQSLGITIKVYHNNTWSNCSITSYNNNVFNNYNIKLFKDNIWQLINN